MYREDAVQTLAVVPVTDGNYRCALKDATEWQLHAAILRMEASGGKNKSRIAACERELRRRKGAGKEEGHVENQG